MDKFGLMGHCSTTGEVVEMNVFIEDLKSTNDARLTSDVCLWSTSGLSREQEGLGRLKLAQR